MLNDSWAFDAPALHCDFSELNYVRLDLLRPACVVSKAEFDCFELGIEDVCQMIIVARDYSYSQIYDGIDSRIDQALT